MPRLQPVLSDLQFQKSPVRPLPVFKRSNHRLRGLQGRLIDFLSPRAYNEPGKTIEEGLRVCVGETIYRLRRERNLSQGDLADRLNVFLSVGVPLGNRRCRARTGQIDPDEPSVRRHARRTGVGRGTRCDSSVPIRLCAARAAGGFQPPQGGGYRSLLHGLPDCTAAVVAGGLAAGLVFASPFLVCGGLCFLFRRRAGLWCGWAVCFLIDLYLRYGSGITWRLTWVTLSFTPQMNYARLFIAWTQLIGMGLLVLLTVICFRTRRQTYRHSENASRISAAGRCSFCCRYRSTSPFGDRGGS